MKKKFIFSAAFVLSLGLFW